MLHLRDDLPGIRQPGAFALVGGGRKEGEASLEETLLRELSEEVRGLRLEGPRRTRWKRPPASTGFACRSRSSPAVGVGTRTVCGCGRGSSCAGLPPTGCTGCTGCA
ncbi:NUDIX domain-containing protein [Streptomyces sp. NPDC048106]|uniref:NUDIX domain-containing protein n=1 Tax=Streptomyces sp. NPDC048106 TaxID=3155750 RepID=UPI003456FA48